MAQGSDSNDTSYKSPSPGSRPSSSDDAKKVMRREKNRIAAQKSRMRQTQKADSLHLESENLEKENAALRKEVKKLSEEAKYLASVLSNHEPLCTGLTPKTPNSCSLLTTAATTTSTSPYHTTSTDLSNYGATPGTRWQQATDLSKQRD